MVVIDATILMLFFRPDVPVPGRGGKAVDMAKERIDHLIQQLEKARSKIIVPTPVLSEILVRAGPAASQEIVEKLNRFAVFRIEPFDARAAIEVAAMTRGALAGTGKKRGNSNAPWAKIKFDRQIVAIAKVARATAIYSDDDDVRTIAGAENIPVIGLHELPLPDDARQGDLLKLLEVQNEPPPEPETDEKGR
jgi:predicted nucleic acid-binding protein